MTPDEVRAASPATPSTCSCTRIATGPRASAGKSSREIADNRRAIAAVLGERELEHFCYPNGDIDPCFLPWLAEGRVRTATTCEPGLASRDDEPLMLPRVVDSAALSRVEFEGWLSGLSSFLPTLRRSRDWRRRAGQPPGPRSAWR